MGLDDQVLDELAWKHNRKPHPAKRTWPKSDLRRQALEE